MRVKTRMENRGEFWLPGDKKHKLYGVLIIQDGGKIVFETNQLFNGHSFKNNIERVIGCLEDGTAVILEDGFYLKYPFFKTLMSDTKIFFNKAYVGLKYTGKKDLKFSEIQFSYENISSWHHSKYLEIKIQKKLPNPLPVFRRYNSPYVYDFKSGMLLEIKPFTSINVSCQNFEMKGELIFKLSSEMKHSLEQYLNHIKVITCLVNFCAQQPLNLINVIGTVDKDDINSGRNEIFIYYQSLFFYPEFNKKQPEFLLNFEHLLDSDIFFNNWCELLKKTHPSIQLYLTSIFDDHKFLEKRYLVLAQALEIFHRGLMDDFSSENEGISFCDRLKELFNHIESYLGSSKKRKSFLGYVVDTRNELTHTGRLNKVIRDKKYSLFQLIDILESVFLILILHHMGVSESEVLRSLQRDCIKVPLL